MSELGPEARSILHAAKDGDDPTSQDRARVRRKLARAIAAGAALGAGTATALEGSAAAAAKTATLLTIAKIGGGLLFVAALGAGIWSTRPLHPGAPPESGAPAITAPSQTGTLPAAAADSPAPNGAADSPAPPRAGSLAPSAADSPAPNTAADSPAPNTAAPNSAPSPLTSRPTEPAAEPADTLEEETRRLREAHGAMQSGDPEKALKLLDQQSSQFSNGQLADERAVARILSLCKLGRESEAQAKIAELARTSPNSPLLSRVQGGCPQPSSN